MQNQPEQIRKPESVNVEWEEFEGFEGNERGYKRGLGLQMQQTWDRQWVNVQFDCGDAPFSDLVRYRRPKTSSVSPQGSVSAPESQAGPSAYPWEEFEGHTTQEKLSEIELHRKLLQTQTELMLEQQKNIQTDRENNALIASQKAHIAELQAQVRRLEQENAMLEVCKPGDAVSPPQE